jgi:acyl-coenzyme A synthetase/AMP-(fatty) acid ligase
VGVQVVKPIGEVLKRSVALKAQEMFGPDCRIINLYGPTEATIECTMHLFDAERDLGAGVPIGVPGDNCSVVLLDASHRFVADGQPGEMYLGGVQLARGYRGRPDLDREKFHYLADGRRMYHSGDIARRMPSGDLEFIGRVDDQVKVLGHRIEPAEISQCLERHPGVLSAAVIVRTSPEHDTNALCAYVTRQPVEDTEDSSEGQDTPDDAAAAKLADAIDLPAVLETFLAELLPAYMMPATIIVVDDIPLNVNGKVDGKALPDPFAAQGGEVRHPVERDEIGNAVAAIWARTLGVEPDGFDEETNFYLLGGNSLLLLTIVASICKEIIGPEGEPSFMAEFGQIVRTTTLEHLTELTRKSSPGSPGLV